MHTKATQKQHTKAQSCQTWVKVSPNGAKVAQSLVFALLVSPQFLELWALCLFSSACAGVSALAL